MRKRDKLWVRFPLEEMKYIVFILRSVVVRQSTGNASRPCPATLLHAEYSEVEKSLMLYYLWWTIGYHLI